MKNQKRFKKNENGAVGIGTLIVFIAMVLVAAIAAAVLINTSGALQDRANKTGAEATDDVSGGIKVQHMEGYVSPQTAGFVPEITILRVYLALHSGTDAIDIEQELSVHLTYIDAENPSESGSADVVHDNNTGGGSPIERFAHNITVDPHQSMENQGSLDQDSIVYIEITFEDFTTIPTEGGLDPTSTGMFKFLISSGMTPTMKGFNCPSSYPSGGGWIELY